jgi:cystathionine beta-lyase/cystathionine gamma-synthase
MPAMDDHGPRSARGFSSRAILAATRNPKVAQQSTAVPIYQSATFASDDAAELATVMRDGTGYTYARLDNPTAAAMAAAIAELEGAEAGFAFGSGMAAIHAALAATLRAGDRVVAARAVYGSTRQLFDRVFARFGVRIDYVDATDLAAVEAALPGARLLYVETISNPTTFVVDIAAVAALAHRAGADLIVDNTFASPYLCRPIELGADVVVASATKWLSGHSDVLAGVVVGSEARMRAVREIEVDTGGIVAPFSAFLVLRGIATLAVRMDRHCDNALTLARWLAAKDDGYPVVYPGLPDHPQAAVAQRQLRAGGGMLTLDMPREVRSASSTRCASRSRPPRWAASGRWSSIRPRHRTGSSMRPAWPRPGSPRASCASASAWRTWRILSPTSPSDWPRRARRSPRSAITTIPLGDAEPPTSATPGPLRWPSGGR